MQITEATAVVLCGGKSSRMGFDKALLKIDHQYVVQKTCQNLQKIFAEILLVTDRKDKFPDQIQRQYSIVEDEFYQKGPLGGLVTALHHIKTPYLFLIACDIPNVSLTDIHQLYEQIQDRQVVLFADNYLETLFAFYHQSCLPILEKQLEKGELKIRTAFSKLDVKQVKTPHLILKNINEPNELNEWK
ncbi:MAG TPA: molybdenum cofactor guanylyltransferase [Tetragenococcus sp.]|nr:molybdenum cofactor guanylyltransferase [Tetragenococcus sp.]